MKTMKQPHEAPAERPVIALHMAPDVYEKFMRVIDLDPDGRTLARDGAPVFAGLPIYRANLPAGHYMKEYADALRPIPFGPVPIESPPLQDPPFKLPLRSWGYR